ncbi:MAG: acetylornithine transaminase [Bacteroidota bacterium]|jgi:predicted acetylornithine/succinylornithine family transaminase
MTTLFDRDQESILHTYKRLPLEIIRGAGVYLVDSDGKRYLDFFGGLAVNSLGYGYRAVLDAVHSQIESYMHLSNLFPQRQQIELAERLREQSGFDKVFFTNSGAEAIETAFKLIRRWSSTRNRSDIFAFSGAFHGRTMAGLSMMDAVKYRQGFGPFLASCHTLPFNNSVALREAVGPATAAVVLECVQGEGGVLPLDADFARELTSLREKYGFLIVDDEIQTGMGRTGKFLAAEHYTLEPDIVALAKSLGGGLPLAAVLVRDELADIFGPGGHGSTFGGNPVACAAGIAVMDALADGVMENARKSGDLLHTGLRALMEQFPNLISDVRGRGCMQGIVCTRPAKVILEHCLRNGLLINVTRDRVVRLLPPLIITSEHIEEALTILRNAFDDLNLSAGPQPDRSTLVSTPSV